MSRIARVLSYFRSHDLASLGVCAILFFFVYAAFYNGNHGLYPSPDEQANAVFAETFARTGDLRIDRSVLVDAVRPRSVNIFGMDFVPGFFLGLVLFAGSIGALFGTWAIPLVPAAMAAAAPIAFYLLSRRVFGDKIARSAALLLFFLPPWAYYASRSFLPNAAMLSAYLAGWAFLMAAHDRLVLRRRGAAILLAMAAGLAFGLSFIIRPVEWVWAAAMLLVVAIFSRSRRRLGLGLIAVLLFFVPVVWLGYWQQQTYGSWQRTGYASLNSAPYLEDAAGQRSLAVVAVGELSQGLFPFGFKILPAFERFFEQTFPWYWPLLIVTFLGFFAYRKQPSKNSVQMLYSIVFAGLSIYLVVYYGSWAIQDHPDPDWVSIGTAYHRYWLPIFVMSLPYLAIGIESAAAQIQRRFVYTRSLVWVAVLTVSAFLAFGYGDDSLGRLKANSVKYEHLRAGVLAVTPPASVIATERQDKLFWPDRQVMTFVDQDYSSVARQARRIPVELYVLTALPSKHMGVIEQRDFVPFQLALTPVFNLEGMTLYRVDSF